MHKAIIVSIATLLIGMGIGMGCGSWYYQHFRLPAAPAVPLPPPAPVFLDNATAQFTVGSWTCQQGIADVTGGTAVIPSGEVVAQGKVR